MTQQGKTIRIAVNGYGVIGKRVADAIACQDDMDLVGVADISTDWRLQSAGHKGFKLFASADDSGGPMRAAGLDVRGTLGELLNSVDVVVDCTPKRAAAKNVERYREAGIKFIVQGGEKHDVTGHSFVAEVSFSGATQRPLFAP